MRPELLIFLSVMICGCIVGKSNESNLVGTWIPVRQTLGGKELPISVVQTQVLILKDTTYHLEAQTLDRGIVKYSKGRMDIYGTEGVNQGKHYPALYKIENGHLIVIYNLAGNGYPSNFNSSVSPNLFLSVFKRQ